MPPDPHEIAVDRAGFMRVWRRADVPLATVLGALSDPGETLKRNEKSLARRVGGYVVKSSEGPSAVQAIRHTLQRNRYRRGWNAARFLERHGVSAPRAIAHIEWGFVGIVWRHATLIEFLGDCRDVERCYDDKAARRFAR